RRAAVAEPRFAPVPRAAEERQAHVLVVALQEDPPDVGALAGGEQQVDDALRIRSAIDVVADEADDVARGELQAVQERPQLRRVAVDVADREEALAHRGRSRTRFVSAASSPSTRSAAL